MDASSLRTWIRPQGLRAGIVIGVAVALVGIAVGTASGAVTPFQQVLVVNAPASPIPIVGTVNVGNTPSNQNVTVSNFPATQPVSGNVNVGNLPTDADGNVKVSPQGTQDVNVVGGGATSPIANKGQTLLQIVPPNNAHEFNVNMKVTYAQIRGCSIQTFVLRGGGHLSFDTAQDVSFPIPLDVTVVRVNNIDLVFSCTSTTLVAGY